MGGKYLRAPDIFFTIMTNPGMVSVSRFASARLGITTGANEFFFVKRLERGKYITSIDEELLYGLLNFTFSFLFFELSSRKPGAGASGIGVKVANRIPIINPECLTERQIDAILAAASSVRARDVLDIEDEIKQPDRQQLDKTLLTALGLDADLTEELYASLAALVAKRVGKAKSV